MKLVSEFRMQNTFLPHRIVGKLASGTGRSRNCLLREPALRGLFRKVAGGRGNGAPADVVNVCVVVAMFGFRCGSDPLYVASPECDAIVSVVHADC